MLQRLTHPGFLRFFLAFLVVLHHSTPLRLGAWAVDVFFVLSGYWISRIWTERYSRTAHPTRTFLVSRWWRLAPVFVASNLLALLVYGVGALPPAVPGLDQPAWLWLLRQAPVLGAGQAVRLLPPAWSLDVEAQFYLSMALALPLLGRLGKAARPVLIAAILASAAVTLVYLWRGGPGERPALWPWLSFFLMGVGVHRLDWAPSKRVALAGLGLFGALLVGILAVGALRGAIWYRGADVFSHAGDSGALALWSWLGALLTVPFAAYGVRQRADAFDTLLGNLSYPLYLVHWLPRVWYYAHARWSDGMARTLPLLALELLAALALALAVYYGVDRPMERLRRRWVARQP